jgi:hypothetical protein
MEFLGLLFGFAFLNLAFLSAGAVIALAGWWTFPEQRRPKRLIFITACVPILSLYYFVACTIGFILFVPDRFPPFSGDFNEPVPHGYILTGLGKMPEYSYFESTPPMMQPHLRGGVRRLELDGEVVYGAYGHLDDGSGFGGRDQDQGYFIFDTRTGEVRNISTIAQLNTAAGHPVHLVDSQSFRSQDPYQVRLRRIESWVYLGPPIAAFLYCVYRLIRFRIRGQETPDPREAWNGTLGLGA